MKDPTGLVLYVGKAKNLRARLSTYFQGTVHEIPRIELLVAQVQAFDVILTETESEALILEATLIKKHKPKFNIRLKDDKSYPYLLVTSDAFPQLQMTRKTGEAGKVHGPFPSAWALRSVIQLLNRTFQLRTCSDNVFRHRSRPCLLYQMEQCSAPCVGKISAEDYQATVREAVEVLEGKSDRVARALERGMAAASENEEFEEAALLRDQSRSLAAVTEIQSVVDASLGGAKGGDRDVAAIARGAGDGEGMSSSGAHGVLLKIRSGKLTGIRHYSLANLDPGLSDVEAYVSFLSQAYWAQNQEAAKRDPEVPPVVREVLVPCSPTDPAELASIERAVAIRWRSSENEVDEQLLRVAENNARYALEQSARRPQGHGYEALEDVREQLHLERFPQRIECYDISNTQGTDAVGSRVVFVDGAPDKNLYRRYKIKTVEGSNDFAMMKEVLARRFSGDEDLPDLLVVDGGRGQLSQAEAILEELDVQGVAIAGLAKARTESDFRGKEVKSSMERVFIPGRKNPILLYPGTPACRLLTHVRDEAHRFAVSYHRLLRSKRTLPSSGAVKGRPRT